MKTKILLSLLVLTLAAFTANAQRRMGMLRDENRSIRHGVRSGQLTRTEAARLKMQESRLKVHRRQFIANDGVLSAAERLRLRTGENRLDRNIRRQKHDAQTRF